MADENFSDDEKIVENFETTSLTGEVGFSTITDQIKSKQLKQGFEFNIMVAGQSGLGKSTFVNALFNGKMLDPKGTKAASEHARSTTEIETRCHLIEEKGVRMKMTVIDTPGFGEQLDNTKCAQPIQQFINERYREYHKAESAIRRERHLRDRRVHVCLYFIPPSNQLRRIDIEAMKTLSPLVNLVPVIAKSDCLTKDEKKRFKKRVKAEIEAHNIQIYPLSYQSIGDYSAPESAANEAANACVPFALSSSVNGHKREMTWGVVETDNPSHSEFSQLRNFLVNTHLQDLIDVTRWQHYESYRTAMLHTRKDKKDKKKEEKSEKKK